jgi:drug/metabolite transporter (DMT)-like permease
VTVVLGLAAAVLYGVGDFAGGIASRRHTAITVLLLSYPVGAVLMALMLPLFGGHLDTRSALYGIAGGVAGLVGVVLMYSLMTVAPINIVSPVTAVLAAIVPVVVGVGIGERPRPEAWFGIALGLGAVILVSRTTEAHPHGRVGARIIALAFVSGLGFGLYFVFLARAGDDSGLWPLVISRFASAALIVPLARARGAFGIVRGRMFGVVVLAGAGCCHWRACSPRSIPRSLSCWRCRCCGSTPVGRNGSVLRSPRVRSCSSRSSAYLGCGSCGGRSDRRPVDHRAALRQAP